MSKRKAAKQLQRLLDLGSIEPCSRRQAVATRTKPTSSTRNANEIVEMLKHAGWYADLKSFQGAFVIVTNAPDDVCAAAARLASV